MAPLLLCASHLPQTVRDKCFDKCVTKPSSSLSSSEQQCLARCCDRCVGGQGKRVFEPASAITLALHAALVSRGGHMHACTGGRLQRSSCCRVNRSHPCCTAALSCLAHAEAEGKPGWASSHPCVCTVHAMRQCLLCTEMDF